MWFKAAMFDPMVTFCSLQNHHHHHHQNNPVYIEYIRYLDSTLVKSALLKVSNIFNAVRVIIKNWRKSEIILPCQLNLSYNHRHILRQNRSKTMVSLLANRSLSWTRFHTCPVNLFEMRSRFTVLNADVDYSDAKVVQKDICLIIIF